MLIPVSGLKVRMVGETTVTLDFGDGTCDRMVDVTIGSTTFTRRIFPRIGNR